MLLFLQIALSGVIATAVMTAFMWLIGERKFAKANLVKLVGAFIQDAGKHFSQIGLTLHFGIGIFFAFIYYGLLSLYNPEMGLSVVIISTMIGAFHGLVFGFFLTVMILRHHPKEKARQYGGFAGPTYFFGHMLYGLVIGLLFNFIGVIYTPII
jgi:hypothetical protein